MNSNDIVAFLNARLDDDEATVRAAGEDTLSGYDWYHSDGGDAVYTEQVPIVVGPYGSLSDEVGDHIARHDPARALREIDAKRAMIQNLPAATLPEWEPTAAVSGSSAAPATLPPAGPTTA